MTELRSWWRESRQRREQRRRRAVEGDVPLSVSTEVLTQRIRLSASELQPILDQLAARRLILPGLTPGAYRIREWTLDPQ